jgi:integrase
MAQPSKPPPIWPADDFEPVVHDPRIASNGVGLMVEVAAITGARLSRIARLEVGDLQPDRLRLMLPRSAKGHDRSKKHERRAVPIPASLVTLLLEAAAGRSSDSPLLLRGDGRAWEAGKNPHRKDFRAVVAACGLDPDRTTLYALRHSSIVRQLLANVPIRLIAVAHDTSVEQIERNYSALISEYSDTLSRAALLDVTPPAGDSPIARQG